MQNFSQIINGSLEWAATVTFRPFKPKKWLILGFVALMGGYIYGGGRINLPNPPPREEQRGVETKKTSAPANALSPAKKSTQTADDEFDRFITQAKEGIKNPLVISVIIVVILLFVSFMVLMTWLTSRFRFIFLEDVVKNDASLRAPFARNKIQGNSLFWFYLAFAVIVFIILGIFAFIVYLVFIKSGVFNHPTGSDVLQIIIGIIALGMLFLGIFFIAAMIGLIVNDFVLIVMFKDKLKVMPAWGKAFAAIKHNKLDFFIYFLIKLGLSIVASIVYSVLSLAIAFGLLMVMMPIAIIIFGLYQLIPPGSGQVIYTTIFLVLTLPPLAFLWYCLLCAYLPIAVFFRAFSVKFMGRIAPEYNLFKLTAPPAGGVVGSAFGGK